ncbi:MAG: SDR family oxidoreductase [Balneolales bacterium]
MILKDKIAVVTGANSGMGAEFSKKLVEKGATVYGLARRKEKLDQTRNQLGERFLPVSVDLSKQDEVDQFVKSTFSVDHKPDILINNAGFGAFAPVDGFPVEKWDEMVGVNLSGMFYITRLIVPLMRANDNVNHIVNIASVAGLVSNPNFSAYNATKFGVRGFSNALMKELRTFGIKVTCFYPGSVSTEFFEKLGRDVHSNMLMGEDVANVMINLLETPDNFLIDEIVMRPLNPKPPEK